MHRIGVFLWLCLSWPAAACTPGQLYALMNERLSFMPAVAAYKAEHGLPMVDVARENLVVAKAVDTATSLGLPAAEAERFARAQITAAKQIQQREQRAGSMSLSHIRQQLIELGDAQLQTLACLREQQWRATAAEMPPFERALRGSGLKPHELEALFQALR